MHLAALPMAKVRISLKSTALIYTLTPSGSGVGMEVGAWVVEGKELRFLCLRMESG